MPDGWVTPLDWPAGPPIGLTAEEIDAALSCITEETVERARALVKEGPDA